MYRCPYCNMKIKGVNAYIMHKRKHMGGGIPIHDPLNPSISKPLMGKNSAYGTGVKL